MVVGSSIKIQVVAVGCANLNDQALNLITDGMLLNFPCSVCGFLIITPGDARVFFENLDLRNGVSNALSGWLSELRAFHPQEPYLTGVGRHLGPPHSPAGCHAPLDPTKSCNDDDYQDNDKVGFKIRLPPRYQPEPSDVGYAVHQSCWQLLHYHAQLHGVEDLTSRRYTRFLFKLHNSTLDGTGRVWAGNYGGLINSDGKITIPASYHARLNPLDIKGVTALVERARDKMVPQMKEKPIFGRRRKLRDLGSFTRTLSTRPPLYALPPELVLMILEQLPLRDILSFWIAFPNVPDFFPQEFWKSRFEHRMEFGHLFEFRELWNSPDVHWYTLFWKAKDLLSSSEVSPAIVNRRRIFPVIDDMIGLVLKYVDCPLEGDPRDGDPVDPILLETDGLPAHEMQLSLPPPDGIEALHIATVHLGGRQYLSGLRLNDNTSGLGYYHGSSNKTLQIDTSLKGQVKEIICFMDHLGVRGLGVATNRGWRSDVFPEPCSGSGLSQGVLPIGKLWVAHFDATKITALGIDRALTAPRDKRNYILWRGCLAPDNVTVDLDRHMYRTILKNRHTPWDIKYNPVGYHLFTTRDSLIGITGYILHLNWNLTGLEFSYRERNNTDTKTVLVGEKQGTPIHFSIDGPGGECITGLKVTTVSAGPLAPVVSPMTNRDRSTWFCIKESLVDIPREFVHETHYTTGQNEYVAGVTWASGGFGDQEYPFWNFGILCQSFPSSYP
ncbi:hypothetical protein FQN50_000507 [Emmonsiellopsis sp. PD_5]|nr:hypothetical protein FQN50_000507 [Emmonsiellopsis sp. PD_5]